MISFAYYMRTLFGGKLGDGDLVALFSVYLDETGTDGRSPYTVVAGAVSDAKNWGNLEAAWSHLLTSRGVKEYHWKEFRDRKDDFDGWSDLKCKRFQERQEKIIRKNTLFRVSIGIESVAHADIKKRMKGVSGFQTESDYSLCLRYLMFATSEQLVKIDPHHRLAILVEAGPFAKGALATYERVAAMRGKWKPAKHAHRLAGFGMAPKGEYRSLEVADYLAATEHSRMCEGKFRPQRGIERLSLLLTKSELERWYEGMIREKEARRAYGKRAPKTTSSAK